ncbi:ABC-F family ATP-binding cassette domain-containing protein [Zavarzinia compransoris]|uniref:Glycosyl transferase family 1 n=1 Tax=Zavarzinia compransoris TaxID=1264899 RepID=A0A317EAW3_9PROT|nr:ABC-F family ATP-binding cassette domain-containing protein [Zavarzinia compransoris]PWR23692.1 glycosyl transferase family 1 [Zavarzinia compransoris]TDP47912.1 ATP-binding cassette subfamily F protein 3 [Zavarzinia compransoris]
MLRIDGLTYRIAGRTILDGAGAMIPDGHRVGLIGHNGAGKSTLFRLILGEAHADDGTVAIDRGARIGTVAQEAPGADETPIDVVLAGDKERARLVAAAETETDPILLAEIHERLTAIGAHSGPARAQRILAGLGFDPEAQARPMRSFSGGWRMRVALAAVLFAEPDLLLLDEPTNYLDLEGTLWLEDFLARYPRTLIVISHDRDLLNHSVNGILHLDQGKLTFYTGGFDRFMRARAEKIALLEAQRNKQDAARKHLQSFVDRFRFKASKAKQAQARLKMIEKMEPLPELPGETRVEFRFPCKDELAPPIVTLAAASIAYENRPPVLRGLNLRIDPDDRIALLGSNGNGKSTFAKAIAGRLPVAAGELFRAPKLRPGFFAQHQQDEFILGETPIQHMQALLPKAGPTEVRSRLGAFGFGAALAETPVGQLSGGEKARLLFAMMAVDAPNMIILDEPTNHLDIQAREALIQAVNEHPGAVILISHDRHLIEACADRLWLVAGGTVKPFDGDMEDYRRQVLAGAFDDGPVKPAADQPAGGDRKEARREAAKAREARAPLVKKIKTIETQLEKLARDLAAVDASLADPKIYNDAPRLADLGKKRADLLKAQESAEMDWLSAQEELETAESA